MQEIVFTVTQAWDFLNFKPFFVKALSSTLSMHPSSRDFLMKKVTCSLSLVPRLSQQSVLAVKLGAEEQSGSQRARPPVGVDVWVARAGLWCH